MDPKLFRNTVFKVKCKILFSRLDGLPDLDNVDFKHLDEGWDDLKQINIFALFGRFLETYIAAACLKDGHVSWNIGPELWLMVMGREKIAK